MGRLTKDRRIERGKPHRITLGHQDREARLTKWKEQLTPEEQAAVERVEGLHVGDICRVLRAELIEKKREPLLSWKERGSMLKYARKLAMDKGKPGLLAQIERVMIMHDQAVYNQFMELAKYLEPVEKESDKHLHIHGGGTNGLPERLRELPELLRELSSIVGSARTSGMDTVESEDPDEVGGVSPVPVELDAEVPVPADPGEVDEEEATEVLHPEGASAGGQHADPGADVREDIPVPK